MIRLLILIFILPLYLIHGQSTKDLINKAEFAYCTLGDIDKTIQILKQIHETPCHLKCKFSFQFKLGELYLEKNDTNNAIKHYQIALNTEAYPGCYRSSQNCKLLPRVRTSSKSQISIKLSQIYSQKKQYDIVKQHLHHASNKFKPRYCCDLDETYHQTNILVEQAKLSFNIGDTIKARNTCLNLIFNHHNIDVEVIQILYTSVKNNMSKKELKNEFLNCIHSGEINDNHYNMVIFNHSVEINMGSTKTKKEIIDVLLNNYIIKQILQEKY